MKVSKPLTFFYVVVTVLLALPGAWLLLAPDMAIVTIHNNVTMVEISSVHGQQTGLGLLLCAAINLVCLMGGRQRKMLHLAVLLYLCGLVASHGQAAESFLWWLWLPVIAYALPLLKVMPLSRIIPAAATGQQRGEVKWFNPNKGFGFILTDKGDELFVHFKAVQNGGRRSLRTGTRVRFTTRMSDRGEQADNVYIEE
ncbi:MAG: cold shock domain-containing protein [Alcanivorax sp.]|nr:cold shock domain-containing protein [Alcanivorax sp.]